MYYMCVGSEGTWLRREVICLSSPIIESVVTSCRRVQQATSQPSHVQK